MQVLLGVEHTVFKINAYVEDYKELLLFIYKNFESKQIKENVLLLPVSSDNNDRRKLLMKWFYAKYKKSAKNFKAQLKYELLKRIQKPIHIHFLESKIKKNTLNATFYEDGICQIVMDYKNDRLHHYLLKYFRGCIQLKSTHFNLYELNIHTPQHKKLLYDFLNQKKIEKISTEIEYDYDALDCFLNLKKNSQKLNQIEHAFKILKVQKTDSIKEIKKAYKQMAKTYHPDLSHLDDEESTKKFQILSDAFTLIKKYKLVA